MEALLHVNARVTSSVYCPCRVTSEEEKTDLDAVHRAGERRWRNHIHGEYWEFLVHRDVCMAFLLATNAKILSRPVCDVYFAQFVRYFCRPPRNVTHLITNAPCWMYFYRHHDQGVTQKLSSLKNVYERQAMQHLRDTKQMHSFKRLRTQLTELYATSNGETLLHQLCHAVEYGLFQSLTEPPDVKTILAFFDNRARTQFEIFTQNVRFPTRESEEECFCTYRRLWKLLMLPIAQELGFAFTMNPETRLLVIKSL